MDFTSCCYACSLTHLCDAKNTTKLEDESTDYPAWWCVQQISLELTVWRPDKLS